MNDSHEEPVLLTVCGNVATVTLNRPGKLNAFDRGQHSALNAALDCVESNPELGAVVLTGAGKAFSSGQDLAERADCFAMGITPDIDHSLGELYNPLISRVTNFPLTIIAAVPGIAFGAGAALAAACDITLAAHSARFQFGFVNIGLGPDCGASWSLPRLVGLQKAMDIVLSARPVFAQEAERIGLVARIVDDDRLLAEAQDLAQQIADGPPEAIQAARKLLRAGGLIGLDDALEAERKTQSRLSTLDSYRQAILRFASKPNPS